MQTYGPRFYLIGSDYVYPRQSNRFVREFLASTGGVVVAERYLDIQARQRDFLPIMRDIDEAGADVIFSTVVGRGTSFLYQAYADAGFDPKRMPIASLTTTEAELRAMGLDVGEAHVTAACYFEGIESEANAAFVGRFKKRFGGDASTNVCAEAAYFQVHLFARALEKTNSLGDRRSSARRSRLGLRGPSGSRADRSRFRSRRPLDADRGREPERVSST